MIGSAVAGCARQDKILQGTQRPHDDFRPPSQSRFRKDPFSTPVDVEGDRMKLPISSSMFFQQIFLQTICIVLLLGAAVGLIFGIMLVFDSGKAFRIADRLNGWVSTRAALRPLEEHRDASRPLYRMHRLVGILLSAGALFSLVVLGSTYGETAILKSLSGLGQARFSSWVSESLRIVLLTGNVGALMFGLVFIVRPSALRSLETWANRQISSRKSTKPIETMYLRPDQFTRAHPRLVGSLVIFGSVYVLVALGYAVLK
jgi:hypothetical protein